MTNLKRNKLKTDNSEKDNSAKEQLVKGRNRKRAIPKRNI